MYLSGDFVDYFPIDDRHVGFYMADVSGHGAASAFVTVMLNTMMIQYRDALWQSGDDGILHPQQILQRLNRDLCRQNLDKHLTLFYGVIDLEQHTLHYSNAGQFPYPLLYDGHEVGSLECPGRPLGLFADAEYRVWQRELPQECILVLVSDGILELMSEDGHADKDTAPCCSDMQGADLDKMTDGLDVLAEKHLPDDIAFLVISRSPAMDNGKVLHASQDDVHVLRFIGNIRYTLSPSIVRFLERFLAVRNRRVLSSILRKPTALTAPISACSPVSPAHAGAR